MILQDVKIDCASGEGYAQTRAPSCYAMQLIQILPTDCARVGIRFQSFPQSCSPSNGWIDVHAGELIPMPFGSTVLGTMAKVPSQPIVFEVTPLYQQNDALIGLDVQRAVFCFIEKPDLTDRPMIGSMGYQRWVLPEKDPLPIIRPADYLEKNWARIPCRRMKRGTITLTNPGVIGTYYAAFAIAELNAELGSSGLALPLALFPTSPNGVLAPGQFSWMFEIGPETEWLHLYAWRGNDAHASVIGPGARIVLSRDPGNNPMTTSVHFAHDCADGLSKYSQSVSNSRRQTSRYGLVRAAIQNNSGAGNMTGVINTFVLTGQSVGEPRHMLAIGSGSAVVAPANRTTWVSSAAPFDAAVVVSTPTAINQSSEGQLQISS